MTNKVLVATDLHTKCARGLVLRLMKRERDLDAHEDADSEAPVNVNDAILSFEKELDRMSEAAAPRVKCAAHCRMLCTHPAAASMRTHVAGASPPVSGLLARTVQVSSWGLQEAGPSAEQR